MTDCLKCGKETANPKFCSKSCANSFNNNKAPKRTVERKCDHCENIIWRSGSRLCQDHFDTKYTRRKERVSETLSKTLGDFRTLPSVANKHPSWVHAHIRLLARYHHKELLKLPCAHCGYDKHVELAHIQSISSFPDTATVAEVNSSDNVIQLCPNCHWEFDNLPRSSES